MTARSTQRLRAAIGATVAGCCLALVGAVGPVGAQDPYGGTTTTTTTADPELVAACALGLTAGAPGATASVRVTNVPFGATVRVLLDGSEVGRGTAPVQGQSVGAPVAFGGQALVAQATTTTLDISFTVPDLAPGRYLVSAVGADFTLRCTSDTDDLFEVLGSSRGREGVASGSLPRTGVYVALLLVIAVVLIVAGRTLLHRSRRRQTAARRDRSGPHPRHRAPTGQI